jgi:hypothetical protein
MMLTALDQAGAQHCLSPMKAEGSRTVRRLCAAEVDQAAIGISQ